MHPDGLTDFFGSAGCGSISHMDWKDLKKSIGFPSQKPAAKSRCQSYSYSTGRGDEEISSIIVIWLA